MVRTYFKKKFHSVLPKKLTVIFSKVIKSIKSTNHLKESLKITSKDKENKVSIPERDNIIKDIISNNKNDFEN